MSKTSTRLTIFGACIAVIVGLMASIAGAATPATPFTMNAANKTMTLNADITTTTTISVPDGYTLNGNGHKITAVDPAGGAFNGAVVQNAGTVMYVKNLTIDGDSLPAAENCARIFNGVAFMAASGSIKGVTLTDIGLPETGCQIGRAILVDNIAGSPRRSVEISGNVVSSYNKNGIDVRGNVDATITKNTVTGSASTAITRNGIVVRNTAVPNPADDLDTATAEVWGNVVSGNVYNGFDASGILVLGHATVDLGKKNNTVTGNDVNIYSEGTLTGKYALSLTLHKATTRREARFGGPRCACSVSTGDDYSVAENTSWRARTRDACSRLPGDVAEATENPSSSASKVP